MSAQLVELEGVSRRFGPVEAVREVSFRVGHGEIVGLLGDNGAGKTTTLRLIAGFLAPDQGRIAIDGVALDREPLAARRKLGVLVEGAPAYPELRVRDYLSFRARLKAIDPQASRGSVVDVLARCELGEVAARKVGQLSRGFRQRVGLADALLGAPPLLLLDEPASGLDPHQVVNLRALIAQLAREHTVIVSSHALGEVEQVATRVIILARGRVVADDTPAALGERLGAGGARVTVAPAALAAALAALGDGARALDEHAGQLHTPLAVDEATRRLVAAGVAVREIHPGRASLEEAFVRLTRGEGGASA